MSLRRRDVLLAGTAAATAASANQVLAQVGSQVRSQAETTARPSMMGEAQAAPYAAPTAEQKINVINLVDLEAEAQKVIPPYGFEFIAGGAGDEWTLRENRLAFDKWVIEPNYLAAIKAPVLATTLLGSKLSMPVIAAPMGSHGFAHVSKENGSARGTAAAGAIYVTTSVSNTSMEEVSVSCGGGAKWYQIFLPEDRGYAREQLQRAKAAGYSCIVFTVDAFTYGNRERVAKLGLKAARHLGFGNLPKSPALAGLNPADNQKTDIGWDDLAFIQKESGLPVVLKGVLTRAVATQAVKRGCAAVWVSNHGGRQLDHSPATISVLPHIAEAVNGKVPVILDSGVRRGQDVFRAIALGASAVAIGRPVLYGLSLGGSQGVEAVFARLRAELAMSMHMAGCADLRKISRDYVAPA